MSVVEANGLVDEYRSGDARLLKAVSLSLEYRYC
jgi:hypothetical protein